MTSSSTAAIQSILNFQIFQSPRYANYYEGGDLSRNDERINPINKESNTNEVGDITKEAFQRVKTREQFKQAKSRLSEETTQKWTSSTTTATTSTSPVGSPTITSEPNNINSIDVLPIERIRQLVLHTCRVIEHRERDEPGP